MSAMETPKKHGELLESFRSNALAAIRYSIAMQFLLLLLFLFTVNFNLLQPMQWITQTLAGLFSLRTWICFIPFVIVVLFYQGALYGRLMARKRYHGSRFNRLMLPLLPKLAFIMLHMALGILSAWFYAGYLPLDYRYFSFECFGSKCLNCRYLFLIYVSLGGSLYHYAKHYACEEPNVKFPLIQERRLVQLRACVYNRIRQNLLQTWFPCLLLVFFYSLLNSNINHVFVALFKLNVDDSCNTIWAVLSDFHLYIYAWLFLTLLLSNLQLFYCFYCIVFSDQLNLPLNTDISREERQQLSLIQALAMDDAPVLQNLAALQLYYISVDTARIAERQQIFALTRLSDHPFNWHHLSTQCLIIIQCYTEELQAAMKNISNVKISTLISDAERLSKTSANDMAQKILLRQHNESLGIRRMLSNPYATSTENTISMRDNFIAKTEQLPKIIQMNIYNALCKVPSFNYLFGVTECAKTAHLLRNAQHLVWLTQGLAGICAASIKEDHYGVVQSTLPDIFTALLKLKFELDKLQNVNLNGKKLDRNLLTLKNAVKRSLYRMCSTFGDYLRDIVTNVHDLQHLLCFLNYQEI